MINFTCEVNESYTFHTTSVIKLMKFLYRNDRRSEFLITVAADKDSCFIEQFLIPNALRNINCFKIIKESRREVKIKFYNPTAFETEFKDSVNALINIIIIMCIFSHDSELFYKIDTMKIKFELNQSMIYDWNFSLTHINDSCIEEDENSEEQQDVICSATTSILSDKVWFITMTIFCYITGRPLVVSSPDCINQYKPSPLPEN